MSFLQTIDLEGFIQYLQHENKADGTIENYLYMLEKLQQANQVQKYLADHKKNRMLIYSWRSYLKYLRFVGKISAEDLAIQLDTYKPPPRRGKTQKHNWYPKKEWDTIISRLPHRVGKMCVYLQLNFGLRVGELVHLRRDIDFTESYVHIQARPGWQPKHAHERSVPCTKAQLRIINRWIENISNNILHNYLVFNTRGDQLSTRNVQKWYLKAGIQSHDLRRSFAKVLYYQSNKDVKLVSNLMGHMNIATTSDYLGLDSEEIQEKYLRAMT